jgi:hypothetical protein
VEVVMQEGYTTSAAALAEQARKVGDALAELRAAADTAGSVALNRTAFGELGTDAAAALDRLGTDGLDTVVTAMNTLVETTSRLRGNAVEYERREASGESVFRTLDKPDDGLVV